MVKSSRKSNSPHTQAAKPHTHEPATRIVTITPDTPYAECSERLTAFGGLLALVKFLDLVGFQARFAEHDSVPKRETKLGHCSMICGILMLVFIGFQRLGHFTYLRHGAHESNECEYQPQGWAQPCRFVGMRIREEQRGERQLHLLLSEEYLVRVFATNAKGRPHRVIEEYDGRAAVEPLIGEAQREGVLAIPSKKFAAHHAFFQIVMLAYNLWRWMKWLAGHAEAQARRGEPVEEQQWITMPNRTLRIARLKMLYVAAKLVLHGNRDEVRYSEHEQRAADIPFQKWNLKRRKNCLNLAVHSGSACVGLTLRPAVASVPACVIPRTPTRKTSPTRNRGGSFASWPSSWTRSR